MKKSSLVTFFLMTLIQTLSIANEYYPKSIAIKDEDFFYNRVRIEHESELAYIYSHQKGHCIHLTFEIVESKKHPIGRYRVDYGVCCFCGKRFNIVKLFPPEGHGEFYIGSVKYAYEQALDECPIRMKNKTHLDDSHP